VEPGFPVALHVVGDRMVEGAREALGHEADRLQRVGDEGRAQVAQPGQRFRSMSAPWRVRCRCGVAAAGLTWDARREKMYVYVVNVLL
jgi:hypothetical protein